MVALSSYLCVLGQVCDTLQQLILSDDYAGKLVVILARRAAMKSSEI